jgi:triosephosphate isomerase
MLRLGLMLVVANWKAYVESPAKAKVLVVAAKKLAAKGDVEIVLAPPAPLLGMFVDAKSKLSFAAQDLSDSTGGAATGEITAALLAGMGVSYVIIGHSERRAMGEGDERIASKIRHALAHGLTPIVCIGERERDVDAAYVQFLRAQIFSIFSALEQKDRMRIVLAYEPIWAIGKSAAESITPNDLHEMVLYIRKVLTDFFPGKGSDAVKILYGGSVEPGNIRMLAGGSQLDGFLVGHAAVDAPTFTALVKAIS